MLQGPAADPCAPVRVFLALYPCFTCSLCLPRPFYMFYTTCARSAGWRSGCVFYRCLCSFALCYRNGNIFMYVFMKLQHHGRALLVFSGEWEGAGGRRGGAADSGSQIILPQACPGAGVGGGAEPGVCSVLCSMQQHSTNIPRQGIAEGTLVPAASRSQRMQGPEEPRPRCLRVLGVFPVSGRSAVRPLPGAPRLCLPRTGPRRDLREHPHGEQCGRPMPN